MKKVFIAVAILVATTASYAQTTSVNSGNNNEKTRKVKKHERILQRKMERKEVSYQSKQAFFHDFGDVKNVQWNHSDYFDEASFIKGGHKTTAYYDVDAKLVGTTSERPFTDLPAGARKYIARKFKNYKPVQTYFFDDNENNDTDMILYGFEFDDEDNYFVEMQNGNKTIILDVSMDGDVQVFKNM